MLCNIVKSVENLVRIFYKRCLVDDFAILSSPSLVAGSWIERVHLCLWKLIYILCYHLLPSLHVLHESSIGIDYERGDLFFYLFHAFHAYLIRHRIWCNIHVSDALPQHFFLICDNLFVKQQLCLLQSKLL